MLIDQIQQRRSVKGSIAACLAANGRSVGAMPFLFLVALAIVFAADTHAQTNTPATGKPTISGVPQVGEILTVDTSVIDDTDGLGAFTYQWFRVDGGTDTDITDATSSSYTLTSDDAGKQVRVRVSFTDDGGNSEQVTSDAWPSSGSIIAVSTAVVLSLSANSVDEDASAIAITVTGTLNGAARTSDTEVTVAVGDSADSASEGTDYATVSDLTLTIDAGETSSTASFTLTPTDDDVDEGDETLSVTGTTRATGLSVTGTTATIVEDDERGVAVSTATLSVPGGGTATYTVVLQSQPTATVTVTPSVSGHADVTVNPSSLSFGTEDWNTAKTVTVSSAQDADGDDDAATVSHAVSGGDYASEPASDVSVTVSDDDTVSNPPAAWATVALDAANSASRGIWSDDTTVWVADSVADKIFAYDLASSARDEARDIDTLDADNTQPRGIWSDGSTMWVADGRQDKIFAYDLASGARRAARDINTLQNVGNNSPMGIWSDGSTMWVADEADDMLYVHSLVSGVRPLGRTIVTLNGAGNNRPRGMWSDGTTMWVADSRDDKIYAYDLASGAREQARDIDTLSAAATNNPWGLWSDGASMLVASIPRGHLARHDVPPAPEPTGWTIGSGCTVGADPPETTEVTVDAVPIVVSSTTDDYFVLYASFDVDGETFEMPVAVVLGEAGTTTLAENAEALAQDRYSIDKYLVADPADVDGDCVDDITELENLSITSPVNAAPAIHRRDGSVSVHTLNSFLNKAYTRPYQFTGTESASGVKILVTDLDTDRPGLYFLDYDSYSYHILVLHELGLQSVDVEGLITYDQSRTAPDGSVGAYYLNLGQGVHMSFSEVERLYTLIAANMAHLDDDLYVHFGNDVLPQLQPEAALYEESRIDILLDADVFPEASFVSMNPGVGFGQLRIQPPDERPHPRDIVIYETLPNELPRVAGIITTVQQTPLSHVNLRAIQNEIPNAYVQDATNHTDITDLIDGYVRYEVTESDWIIRAATPAEVDAHYAASRPTATQTPVRDLTVETITALSDVGFDDSDAFGVKAANVAELGTLGFAAGTVPDGFAIPFYFYDEFMKANGLYDDIDAMLADEDFQADFDVQDDMLDDLRDDIKDATTPQWIIDALTDMHAEFPEGQSLRYRSSTNNEDLPGFNGAGLYDSKTQKPDETEEDGIDKSLKQVYASMWNFRAFTEREFYRVDHTKAAMGVLVHPNYTDELVNGVAVSFDPFYDLDLFYYVNSQVGEDLVTNPEAHSKPEELLVSSTDDDYWVLASSNLVPSGQLLMSDDQLQQLAEHLQAIHDHFEQLYDPGADEPFAIEIEFKITSENILAIKQARPWVFPEALEDATAVALWLSTSSVDEDADATSITVSGTLNGLSRTTDTTVTVEVGSSGDTAVEGTDYATVADLTLTINAGETLGTATFTLTPTDDDVDEGDETLSVTGTTTETDLSVSGTTATIVEDDERGVTVSTPTLTVPEGGTAVYTVALQSQPTAAVTATPSVSGDADVTVSPSSLSFGTGDWNTAKTVTVSAAQDGDADDDAATVSHAVSGGDYASETAADVEVMVADDDGTQVTVDFDQASYTVAEGSDRAITVTLSADSGRTVVIPLVAADQGGASNDDYSGIPASVAFSSGETETTFTFSASADFVEDSGESVMLYLGVMPTGVTAGTVADTTVSITDTPVLSGLSVADEDDGAVALTPALDQAVGDYTAVVSEDVDEMTVSATRNHGGASVRIIEGDGTTTAADEATVSLRYGENVVAVEVTAEDGVTAMTYAITITRERPWSATLTVGVNGSTVPASSGFSAYTSHRGGLSEQYVTLDGNRYKVLILMHVAGGLYLGTKTEMPGDFTLHVGDLEFRGSDSSVPVMRTRGAYWWALEDPGWAKDDEVAVGITVPEEPQSMSERPLASPVARFSQLPASHDGSKAIVLRISFSDTFEMDFRTLRDHALEATNGEVRRAKRVNKDSNLKWEIRVKPDGTDDVVITLPATEDCADDGALCTTDGRMLYNTVSVTIPGP
ncbi:MAG: cadherin-like beta sandwich domain-containing protein [Chloroflexi bacterium]|nr:cadherin-like beta sandwich domain-containing protein [Chloroflexota bacterium]